MSRAVAALVLATAGALSACGGADEPGEAGLQWVDEPDVVRAPTGGSDRVVVGDIRNSGAENVQLTAEEVQVRDATGDRVRSDARFLSTFVHGLYGADVPARKLPDSERLRLGLTVVLAPEGTTPVYAAFRGAGAEPPLSLVVGGEGLAIPTG